MTRRATFTQADLVRAADAAIRTIAAAALFAVAVPLTALSVVIYACLRAWEERK